MASLAEWLSGKDATKAGRRVGTRNQVDKLLTEQVEPQRRAGLLQACQSDQRLAERIEPFANLLRLDLRDRPRVFLDGSLYVTETGSRRDSGTAYTTRELADEVVEHALAPLCYAPGPQDTPDTNRWRIRTSAEILDLKVCDPAVGSGAILVAACRYLADRLIEAWRAEGRPNALDTATAADDPNRLDIVIEARRLVAERCCYGVDRNPMATEMTKLSMWITTVAKEPTLYVPGSLDQVRRQPARYHRPRSTPHAPLRPRDREGAADANPRIHHRRRGGRSRRTTCGAGIGVEA